MRALEESKRHFLVGSAHHAPAGAAGDSGNEPAFLRIGIKQQQRTCRYFTHSRTITGSSKGELNDFSKGVGVRGLGTGKRLVMDVPTFMISKEGKFRMADEESILASPPTQDVANHVDDYSNFTRLFKWGAIVCLIVGLTWMLIVRAYW